MSLPGILTWAGLAGLVALAAIVLSRKPSNDRAWSPDQALLSRAEFEGDRVRVFGIRNFTYASAGDYTIAHYDREFDLAQAVSIDFVVCPFVALKAGAHTFLSFGFSDGSRLAISVEIRKEQGERYSMINGMFRAYEIMYVVGDERDLIGLRVLHRNERVMVYPLRARPDQVRNLLVEMLQRVNRLGEQPEFYHTLFNNCTTAIRRHMNTVVVRKIPFNWKILLPAYSDLLAYERGAIDTELSLEEARRHFEVNERVRRYAGDPDFSRRIRP